MRKDFFISFTSADKDWAERIARWLEDAGYSTVFQPWDFELGRNFVLEMQHGLINADRLILVLSPDYLSSEFAAAEWAAMFRRDPTGAGRRVLPIKVRSCNPEGLLSTIVHIDLSDINHVAAKNTLLKAVAKGRAKLDPISSSEDFPGTQISTYAAHERAINSEAKRADISGYAIELQRGSRIEASLGQSDVIALGYESPVLELPSDFDGSDKRSIYLKAIGQLRPTEGHAPEDLYDRWRRDLPPKFRNDPNVILEEPLTSLSDHAKAYPCDFSIIFGLEEDFNWRPFGATGNILPVTSDGTTVLLLNRGRRISLDAPEHFHVFGGALDPFHDLGSLARCAEREFHEESGRACSVSGCPVLLHRESKFKKSMITYLGAAVSSTHGHETEEGLVYPLDIRRDDDVIRLFVNSDWVDSGRQAFLVWFGLGCPVQGRPSPTIPATYASEMFIRLLAICGDKGLVPAPK